MAESEIELLRREVARLQSRLDAFERPNDDATNTSAAIARPAPQATSGAGTTRRTLFAGAVAAGGAALLTGRRAVAANGQPVDQGEVNECTETTEIKFPGNLGGARPRSHVFVAQDGAWSTPSSPSGTVESEGGSLASIAAFSGNHAMHGIYSQTNAGTPGSAGGRFVGENALSYGLVVQGRRASLRLRRPDGTQPPPPSTFGSHQDGEITVDSNRDVWLCVTSGSPGTWRKLSGPSAAGSYHPIAPSRVLDSRLPMPGSGEFGSNSSRVVSVKDARHVQTGGITATNVVPVGATAVTFNVTIARTVGSGHVLIAPGDQGSITGSTINWSTSGAAIANGGTVKLDANRQVKIFCAVGKTHVILDITGYYR